MENQETGFKEKEKVYAIATKEGEEIRFSVVEVNGQTRADIRYFAEWGDVRGLRPTRGGITIDPTDFAKFIQGTDKLFKTIPGVVKKAKVFKKPEKIFAIPMKEGEELRFSIVGVGGQPRADIRYFADCGEAKGFRETRSGLTVDPQHAAKFLQGTTALIKRFAGK